jgi:dTDP-4-amino-4,6-dideoxygalactose transaminase
MKVRYRDLSVTDPAERAELMEAFARLLDHGQFLLGPEVESFEEEFATRCGRRHCVAVGSGTDALHLALRALGIGPGDEVITTPLSWISTLQAIDATGATSVFADIGDDLNLDVATVGPLLTPRTKAIVPVHFNGRLCDMASLTLLAERAGVTVVEDAAQAFGARVDGTVAGGFGTLAAFSLNPMKNPRGFGEAGAVVTDSEALRERLEVLRYVGTVNREVCIEHSLNFKVDALQAALIRVSLRRAEAVTARRLEIARRYTETLSGVVSCPPVEDGTDRPSVFFDYTIQTDRRDELADFLRRRGIEVKIKHARLMPDQPAYAHLPRPRIPRARELVAKILTLPLHEKLSDDQVDYVIESVGLFHGGRTPRE